MNYLKTIFLFIKDLIGRHPQQLIFLVIAIVCESLIISVSVLSVIPFADYLVDPTLVNASSYTKIAIKVFNYFEINPSYISFATVFILSNLLRSLFNLVIRYRILKIKFLIQKSFSKEILTKMLLAKWSFYTSLRYGKILNNLTKEIDNIGTASRSIIEVFSSVLSIITFLFVPFMIDPLTTMLVVVSCLFIGFPFLILSKKSKRLGYKRSESANKYYSKLNETINAAKLIIGFNASKVQIEDNINLLNDYTKNDLNSQFVNLIAIYLFKPLAIIALIIIFGSSFELKSFSSYAAIFWGLFGALPLVGHIFNTAVVVNNYHPSYNQIKEIIKRAEIHFEDNNGSQVIDINRDIIFENVCFSYKDVEVLKNLNLTIKKNKITILTGESGCGKTTVLDLLISLLKKNSGNIYINDIEIDDLNCKSFRNLIGYVPQESYLFYSTIRKNLEWCNPNVTNLEIVEALKLANAYDFVMKFPKKLESHVGEKGMEISGGQRQRIALARSLVRRPKILVLDEPTSAIDLESQQLIKESLNKISRNTTILIASHEKSIFEIANQIYNLKKLN